MRLRFLLVTYTVLRQYLITLASNQKMQKIVYEKINRSLTPQSFKLPIKNITKISKGHGFNTTKIQKEYLLQINKNTTLYKNEKEHHPSLPK